MLKFELEKTNHWLTEINNICLSNLENIRIFQIAPTNAFGPNIVKIPP